MRQNTAPAPRRPNEVLVRFRGVQSQQNKNDIAAAHGLRRQRTLRGESGIEKLVLATGTDVDNAVWQLIQDPAVESAEPNFLIAHDQLGTSPNDPRFASNERDAVTIVNELPHIAGIKGGWPNREEYDDYALAVATYNSKYAKFSNLSTERVNPFLAFPDYRKAGKNDQRYDGRWSSYFHDILRQFCVVE